MLVVFSSDIMGKRIDISCKMKYDKYTMCVYAQKYNYERKIVG